MSSWRAVVRMAILALLWGSSYLWIKLALGGFGPLQIACLRLVLGALMLAVLLRVTRGQLPRGRALLGRIVVPAVLGNAIPFSLFAFGERTVDSGVAGVLNATTPLWALLIGLVIGSERWSNRVKLAGLVIGFGGVLVIFAPWQATGLDPLGALLCLIAAASYAVSYVYIARTLSARVPPLALATTQLSMGAVLTAAAVPVGGELTVRLVPSAALAVAVLGALGTGIAFLLNNRILAEEGATAAASVSYLVPVVSVLLGALVLDEQLPLRMVLGMAVVLTGVVLTRRGNRPAPVDVAAAAQPAGR